ncbi:class I SAM-dependent methyltransferase [Candidatus Sumerlaeota bacterium]|nr:class I SAM-dependent methyltransferase [Candidatus Sumerlaeota bacterium]
MNSANTDQQIAIFFDQCAEQRLMTEFPPEERVKLEQFFSLWEIQPGHRVLEPGCGSGRLTAELAQAVGAQGEVYACDLSPGMLRIAQERQLPDCVHWAQTSALNIRRPDDWFDRVLCFCVFPHFMEPERVLQEFARVLKPDGRLWVNHFEGRESLNSFHRNAAPEVARHALPDADGMRELMEKAGFRVEQLIDCDDRYILGAVLE